MDSLQVQERDRPVLKDELSKRAFNEGDGASALAVDCEQTLDERPPVHFSRAADCYIKGKTNIHVYAAVGGGRSYYEFIIFYIPDRGAKRSNHPFDSSFVHFPTHDPAEYFGINGVFALCGIAQSNDGIIPHLAPLNSGVRARFTKRPMDRGQNIEWGGFHPPFQVSTAVGNGKVQSVRNFPKIHGAPCCDTSLIQGVAAVEDSRDSQLFSFAGDRFVKDVFVSFISGLRICINDHDCFASGENIATNSMQLLDIRLRPS